MTVSVRAIYYAGLVYRVGGKEFEPVKHRLLKLTCRQAAFNNGVLACIETHHERDASALSLAAPSPHPISESVDEHGGVGCSLNVMKITQYI